MKKYLSLAIITLVFFSCKNEKIQVISDYEQRISENVKMDLNFKVKEFKTISKIFTTDSIKYFESYFENEFGWPVDSILVRSNQIDTLLSHLKIYRLKSAEYGNVERVIELNDEIENYNNIKSLINKYNFYKSSTDKLLCTKNVCKFNMRNPLTGIKQEIIKTYYISADNKILSTE